MLVVKKTNGRFCYYTHTFEQALGTGIASELDLAYWHAHYTAASLFDAGGVTADTAASVVPPPEVYFVGLAFHVPSLAELRAFPGMTNPALRDMLSRVFDLPVDAEEFRAAGVCVYFCLCEPVAGRVCCVEFADRVCSAEGLHGGLAHVLMAHGGCRCFFSGAMLYVTTKCYSY